MREMVADYWYRVHKRALREARHALMVDSWESVVVAIILAVMALALIWLFGTHEAALHELIVRLALTAAIILTFPFVYAWKFYTAPARIDQENTSEIEILRQEVPRISVVAAMFDPNGPTEFYLDIKIANPGPPTTMSKWMLTVVSDGKRLEGLIPRFIHGGFPIKNVFSGLEQDDFTKHPLPAGATKQIRLGFTFENSAEDYFTISKSVFMVTAEDVRGNLINTEFNGQ